MKNYKGHATLYHVTETKNLDAIRVKGLVPTIGPRARMMREPLPAVYLFPHEWAIEDALMNWLGDAFGDEVSLRVLKLRVPLNWLMRHRVRNQTAGYEVVVDAVVPYQFVVGISAEI